MTSLLLLAAVGLQPGDVVAPFEPLHVSGPFKGVRQCPVCEWSLCPLVFIWNNGGDPKAVREIAAAAGELAAGTRTKVLVIDANANAKDKESEARLTSWSKEWNLSNVYMMVRCADIKSVLKNYKLQDLKGWKTVVYTATDRKVQKAFVDPKPTDLGSIKDAISAIR